MLSYPLALTLLSIVNILEKMNSLFIGILLRVRLAGWGASPTRCFSILCIDLSIVNILEKMNSLFIADKALSVLRMSLDHVFLMLEVHTLIGSLTQELLKRL
jgi:hypothetical protein